MDEYHIESMRARRIKTVDGGSHVICGEDGPGR